VDPRRLSWGEWLAAAGGVLMFVALFLPWYSVAGEKLSAWEAMALDDIILALAAVLAIVAAVVVAFPRLSSLSVATTALAILPAVVGLVVTIYRLVSPAPAADASLEVGAWLGLVGTSAIAIGAWAGAADEGAARRSPQAERRAAEAALARSELLTLPPDGGGEGAESAGS
jgi:hypothetical protein